MGHSNAKSCLTNVDGSLLPSIPTEKCLHISTSPTQASSSNNEKQETQTNSKVIGC